jgi:hypothetical protein
MNEPIPSSPLPAFKDSQHKDFYLDKLIQSAKKLCATTLKEAEGTCLTTSLEFCLLAREFDIPVELVMWPVADDPAFCDHWAVRINKTQVVDLTRIQVDKKLSTDVVFEITDYPKNYRVPRFYATAPLLDEYTLFENTYSGKLPPALIKNIRGLMLKQDLDSVNHFKNFSGMTSALFSYAKFRLYLYLAQLDERLKTRRDAIKKR